MRNKVPLSVVKISKIFSPLLISSFLSEDEKSSNMQPENETQHNSARQNSTNRFIFFPPVTFFRQALLPQFSQNRAPGFRGAPQFWQKRGFVDSVAAAAAPNFAAAFCPSD